MLRVGDPSARQTLRVLPVDSDASALAKYDFKLQNAKSIFRTASVGTVCTIVKVVTVTAGVNISRDCPQARFRLARPSRTPRQWFKY